MDTRQTTIHGCHVQLDFPAQTPTDVQLYLSTILTELAFEQAEKGGEQNKTGEVPVQGIDKEAG